MITKLNLTERTIESYAIRKLTPKECFRLMGVRDKVIAVMQSTKTVVRNVLNKLTGKKEKQEVTEPIISNSQQYKQAGNSIVVDVIVRVLENLFYPAPSQTSPKGEEPQSGECNQTPLPIEGEGLGKRVLLTTFSGYDSQAMAMNVLKEQHPDFDWEWAGWSDIDGPACTMHNLIFPEAADLALGDITKIDWHAVKQRLAGREVDLFTYSSPCQDISQAGKQMGLAEGTGTRSALLWNVADAVEVLRPKYLMQENVAALVSKKFIGDFQKWLDKLSELGYTSYWARLNAKDIANVPQNRDRVFCISIRNDLNFPYQFPEKIPLTRTLEDILEPEVDERYFLKDDAVGKFLETNNTDLAVFLQVSLPPRHEDAMFLKACLTAYMEATYMWELQPQEIETKANEYINTMFQEIYHDWKQDNEYPSCHVKELYERFLTEEDDAEEHTA